MESPSLNNENIKNCSVFNNNAEVNSMEGKAPMSICVQSLAGDIYKELESLVSMYGNKFLHNLMPLVVTVLENLDALLADKQDLKLQVAVLEEDNRHLHSEYEREKNGRKTAETKLLRVEDEFDEERKLHVTKQTELESNARVLELKLKNLSDQLSRLEENEHEMNRQYQCLRDRYTCLFRYFAEYVERARNGFHINKCDPSPLAPDSFPFSQNPSSTSAFHLLDHPLGQTVDPAFPKSCDCCQFNLTLGRENIDFDGTSLLTERQRIMRNILETTPELQDSAGYSAQQLADPSFDEFSQGDFLSEDGHDVKSFDGSCCTPQANPGDTASSDMFSGVTKEINNLIKENQDLVQTKNALNVVTNDLIGRIDDLTCENVRLSSERSVLITNGTGMLVRIKDLERECRRLRQELDSTDLRDSVYSDSLPSDNSGNEDEGSPEPLAMRKRFSRVEMARVLLERNYYKEQLIELQDTIRWTEMLRVEQRNRTGSRTFKKSGVLWNWFSRLFTPKSRENLSTVVTYQSSASPRTPNNSSQSRSRVENDPVPVHVGSNGSVKTTVAPAVPCSNSSQITTHTQNTDRPQRNFISGRLLRLARQSEWITLRKTSDPAFNAALRMSAPYTCYVRPLSENMPNLRIWCATNIYADRTICASHTSESSWAHTGHPNSNVCLSSTVWICSVSSKPFKCARSEQPSNSASDSNHSTVHSLITIIDADEPTQNLDSFAIPSATVLCMTSIPGNTSDTHSHLKQTENYWQAIPLDLSEELMPFQRRATYPVHGTSFPFFSRSACVSTSSVSISTTQHRHPSMMEMGNSLYSVTGSISRTSASNPEGAFSYFVERRKFLVHSGINELERFKSTTPARPDFGPEQSAGGHTVTSSELPSSSTCPSAPNSVTGTTAFPPRPSSAQPTVWIGCYDGTVFVHSSVTKWRHCLHALHLPDSVTQIRHHKGRTFVSLANGQLVVFRRRLHCPQFSSSSSTQSAKAIIVSSSNLPDSGSRNMSPNSFTSGMQEAETVTRSVCSSNDVDLFACVWDFTEACVITCDLVRSTARQLIVVPSDDTIWTSCRKRITVIDAVTLQLINSFEVQCEGDATIRHMTLSDSGVWVGLRNQPILFLYHTSSHTHLQTVNLEPLISSRLGDLQSSHLSNRHNQRISSPVGVTALLASEGNLWVGTNSGLVITIPLRKPGDIDRATNQSSTSLAIGESTTDVSTSRAERGISSLLLSHMKVSRHEHGRSVRFFVEVNRMGSRHSDPYHLNVLASSFVGRDVPQTSTPLKRSNSYLSHFYSHSLCSPEKLIISGGQGYRFNEDSVLEKSTPVERDSHLIVWNCTQAIPP